MISYQIIEVGATKGMLEVMAKTLLKSCGLRNEFNTCSRLRQLRGQWSREPKTPSDRPAAMTS